MSDDTPTARLPQSAPDATSSTAAPTDATPTVPFQSTAPSPPTVPSTPTVPFQPTVPFERPPTRPRQERPSRLPAVLFVILAVVVGAALVVLIVILDGRLATSGQAVPSGSPTASTAPASAPSAATPSAAPAATPATEPAGTFTTLQVPQTQGGCRKQGAPTVQVTWATANATSVWIAAGTRDATTDNGTQLPLSGNQASVPQSFTLDCSQRTNTFTITLVGDDGAHVSTTWTVQIAGGRGFRH